MTNGLRVIKSVLSIASALTLLIARILLTYLSLRVKMISWFIVSKYRFKSTLRRYGVPKNLINELLSIYEYKVKENLINHVSIKSIIKQGISIIKS